MKIAEDQREAILKEHLQITNLFVAEFAESFRAYIKSVLIGWGWKSIIAPAMTKRE